MSWAGMDGLNCAFLYGHVVDLSISSRNERLECKCTLRVRSGKKHPSYAYVAFYGYRSVADVMTLVCQNGNAIYVEASFGCLKGDDAPRLIASKVECLSRKARAPTEDILSVLDESDPIRYLESKRRKKRKEREQ